MYKILFKNENKYHNGVIKRKIKNQIKQHEKDIRLLKGNTALAQKYEQQEIEGDFNKAKKLPKYVNETNDRKIGHRDIEF